MTLSYKWLSEYLPLTLEPERLSRILTSIGLEVESMEHYESIKGGLEGLVIGEVLETSPHPNADKLKLTSVYIGKGDPLNIVCGAANVAPGQRVVVAPVGATIYPSSGDPMTMRLAKIRGIESHGMICAEDEIGLGSSHDGIMVLPAGTEVGIPAAQYFQPYSDILFEIGLTPNRADAMSHWGVARDVCAYMSHHDRREMKPLLPASPSKMEGSGLSITVSVENLAACPRYSGICLSGVTVGPSPKWMQDRLKAIGLRPINNIVDITNYIQHETGQPLHAFDYDKVKGNRIIVKNLPEGTLFRTLDEKERKLSADDLMICDAEGGICIAGVFGGANSGVTEETKNIFLESAFFDPTSIRKTSFRHNLRTDAATRFEKGTDISGTVTVLKRAAQLVTELAGARVASPLTDIYPEPEPRREVLLKNQYLKKLSGKNYHPETVKNILHSLGFGIVRESMDALTVDVPYHKRDVSLPADIVEEIMRIEGLDNIEIPGAITMTPSIEPNYAGAALREKLANGLVGLGFQEILTNSITNSAYTPHLDPETTVRLLNNLSSELDLLRPSMLPTALEVIAFNHNRRNSDLRLFEFGKTYQKNEEGNYLETSWLCCYLTGNLQETGWKGKAASADLYYLKGVAENLVRLSGGQVSFEPGEADADWKQPLNVKASNRNAGMIGQVSDTLLHRFSLKQPVFAIQLRWDALVEISEENQVKYKEVPRFPAVERDLALVVPNSTQYESIRTLVSGLRLQKLQTVRLFDVFESEKLGAGKKSMAVSFTFQDEEKTLTDKEIDSWMQKIMQSMEKELGAEIRKQ